MLNILIATLLTAGRLYASTLDTLCEQEIPKKAAIQLSIANAHDLLTRQKEGITTITESSPGSDKVRLLAKGIPPVKLVNLEGRVLRHYIKNTESLNDILASSQLRAGTTPYVHSTSKWYRVTHPDVTGVFLTTPDHKENEIGVFQGSPYIDLKIYPGTAVLELEPGIFLVPGEPNKFEVPISILDKSPGT